MDIVGNGFLAGRLRSISQLFPDAVVLAAGVSAASDTPQEQFGREADLVYDAAQRCVAQGRRLVFFSTAATWMYSGSGSTGHEDGPVFPSTPYGRHKLALEAALISSSADYLVLRLTHVAGPGQPPHQLLPALAQQVLGGHVRLYRGARRDLIDIEDVVRVIHELLRLGTVRQVVNVATGYATPIEDIVDHIEKLLGTTARREYVDAVQRVPAVQPVSVEKLHRLVPIADQLGFGPDTFRSIIGKYLHTYVPGQPPPADARQLT